MKAIKEYFKKELEKTFEEKITKIEIDKWNWDGCDAWDLISFKINGKLIKTEEVSNWKNTNDAGVIFNYDNKEYFIETKVI